MLQRRGIHRKLSVKLRIHVKLQEIKHAITCYAENGNKVTTSYLVKLVYKFCEMYSEIHYYPYQEQFAKRIIRSLLTNDGDEISALFSRQTGKSECVATTVGGCMIILPTLANMPMFADDKRLSMFRKGLYVGIFAPSLRQAQTTFNRMKTRLTCTNSQVILDEFGLEFSTSNGQTVALTNGSFATSVSASDRSNIEGDSYMLIICEECQDISSFKIRKSIHPMGASYNASIIKIGTATTFKGDFYEVIERNKKAYKEGKIKIRNHFEYDYKICQKYNEKYRKYVEKEKHRLGEHSDEFRMSYGLEWILERGMFIDVMQLENLCGLKDARRVKKDLTKEHIVGIDIAKKDDSTVITVIEVDWDNPVIIETQKTKSNESIQYTVYKTHIKDWYELNGDNYDKQYYEILNYLKNFKVKKIMIDATKEEGMCDRLQVNLPGIEVVACIFSSQFKDRMYKTLDSSIKCGRSTYPCDEETQATREYQKFIEQMGELEKDFRGQLMVCHHPDRRGAHDDYCLSLNTEILTKRGFLRYDELSEDDLVAKVVNNRIEYVTPTKIIYKDYNGKMYRFKSKDLCLEVTENHKMMTRHRKSGKEVTMLSQELANMPTSTRYNTVSIPVAPIQDLPDYPVSDDLIKQIAWFITEGWINKSSKYNSYRYSFAQSKDKPGYKSIVDFVERMGLQPYTHTRKDSVTYWTFHEKDNKLFDSVMSEGIHRIPREWLSNLSQRQLKLLLDTLMLGDGTISRNTYHTKDYALAQDVQELCHKLGIKASLKNQNRNGYIMYAVYLMQKDETRVKEVEEYEYTGKVWCVNVDNGFIVTRCNDKIAVTGNCDSWALAVLGAHDKCQEIKVQGYQENKIFSSHSKGLYTRINKYTARRRR